MLFSRREFIKIVVPLVIEQLLAVTIGMMDSMMVSSAGEAAISGVSLVDTFNLLLVYMFGALATGGSVVISQTLGRRDLDGARNAAKQLILCVVAVSCGITAIAVGFRKPLLRLIFGSIEADVMANALIYFLFTALSYPFLGLYNSGAAIFRAMGNSRISMLASLLMNVINVCGNALLIFVFHMGAAGAAIATLFSRVVGAALMQVLLHNRRNPVYVEKLLKTKPDWAVIKRICGIGIPNGLENSMFQLGKVLTQSLISTFGTVQIAANAVGNAVTALQYIPGTAIGMASITIVGRCVGALEKEQAKKYARILLGLAYGLILCVSLVIVIFMEQIIGLYGLSEASAEFARKIIFLHSICVCTIWPLAFTIPNSFRAASDVRYTMVISILSMWIFRVGLSYVFGQYLQMGVLGVWVAMFCDWLFRGVLFLIRFLRGTWLTKYHAIGKAASRR